MVKYLEVFFMTGASLDFPPFTTTWACQTCSLMGKLTKRCVDVSDFSLGPCAGYSVAFPNDHHTKACTYVSEVFSDPVF